jgi:hypothetical protein
LADFFFEDEFLKLKWCMCLWSLLIRLGCKNFFKMRTIVFSRGVLIYNLFKMKNNFTEVMSRRTKN